ncbi:TetR/AcrR family transcriptional regulator [Weissella paramesenteroides]|uniref:TetR/AcrR family transcriptional regulator n=1 Tax=Weissella paramesenteroides TaxID=1249 RepID=UPI002074A5C3|nr:TetR/AcrR family transcriptional regulator [Weissella paramesenteroides]MCM6766178.1 TetR/AcrR family transcriptional regulator [Weissella paramesenteroides]MCM6767554.1 TetR/AcrR family transcriptional regulator [Weissella paramesenteroides]MCM6770269.1 TetR/AcrR family transcriptional regulator [Weissella paramesenteroides]MCM6780192.1 TetR/AcrR family transcriptional regulator [Weissella paramesenteroides]MCM6781237.1 TetR/AcrR family transcriptional regulator [Weissella paramesenteroide
MQRDKRFEQMREETQSKIEDAALRTFVKNGISDTKMQDIAKAANVSSGVTYRYFSSKDELIKKVLSNAGEGLLNANNTLLNGANSPKSTFMALASHMLLEINDNDDAAKFATLVYQILGTKNGYELAKESGLIAQHIALKDNLAKIFSLGQSSGDFKSGDAYEFSCFFISSFQGVAMTKLVLGDQFIMPSLTTFTNFIIKEN